MSNTRNLADLLDTSGDIKSAALDNITPTTSASDLTSGTLASARIADDTITTAKVADGQITAAKVAADVATQAEIDAKLNLSGGTLTGTLTMESTDAGNAAAPELILYRNSASPSSGDYLGQVQFKGENANGAQEIYAKVTGKISDPTHTSEDGLIETAIKGDGSFTIVSRQKSDELQLLNGVNLDVAGNIVVGGTVDGIDIATRDAVLTSTTTTANAALPLAGGTLTGNTNLTKSSPVLKVNESGGGDVRIHATGSAGGIGTYSNHTFSILTNSTARLNIDNSGNVGISEASPSYPLHVDGTIKATGTNNLPALIVDGNSTNEGDIVCADGGHITFGQHTLDGNTGSFTERMRITSGGKVGIGTTSPQKLLDITDSSSGESIPLVISNRDTTSGTGQKVTLGFGLARDGGALKPEAGTIEVGREAAWNTDATVDSYMAFSTYLNNSATEKMRITSGGNVGIGTSSPNAILDVDGNAIGLPTSASNPSSPSAGWMYYNTTNDLVSVYTGSGWGSLSIVPFSATGGTKTTVGSYTVHTFTSSGTFTPNKAGTVDVLVVAGGGGGGTCNTSFQGGGGGGAGGFITSSGTSGRNTSAISSLSVSGQAYSVTVGAGGTGGSFAEDQPGTQGSTSSFSTVSAVGGGGGGGNSTEGTTGGSGGGGKESDGTGRSGTSGQGYNGGNGSEGADKGGGGGGAGAVGNNTGNGGSGISNSLRTGSGIYYAGGGGCGGNGPSSGGNGGGGGGGVAGSANTGGGGGSDTGSSSSTKGQNGGSGIVVIRYTT